MIVLACIECIMMSSLNYTKTSKHSWGIIIPILLVFGSKFVTVVNEMNHKSNNEKPPKRKKIRHADVWGPQIVMTLIEAIINVFTFVIMMADCMKVLKHFTVMHDIH